MTTALTRKLGEFIAGLRYEQIPAAATSVIRTGFTDCVMVAKRIAALTHAAPFS